MKVAPALTVIFAAGTLCGCKSAFSRRSDANIAQSEIRLLVLNYMVTNCNSQAEFVCFADVPDEMLSKLRVRSGPPWLILPITQAEHTNEVVVEAESSKKIRRPLLRAKGTEREGIIIGIGEARFYGRRAELEGFGESSSAGWRDRYEVSLVGGAWSIVSTENIMVADFFRGEEILDSDK
jgi:hypothetical protein